MVAEKVIVITEWIEAKCPYCRYVYYSILKDLQVRRDQLNRKLVKEGHFPMPILEIHLVDVEANRGNKEMQWFELYSRKVGGRFTPAIRVGNSQKIFYLWGDRDKGESLDQKKLSNTDKLKSDIVAEIEDILARIDRKPKYYDDFMYNHRKVMEITTPRVMYTPFNGFIGGNR